MPRIRSRVHRIFLHWLKANRCRFVCQPYIFRRRTGRILEFSFHGISRAIVCALDSRSGISVAVMHRGECWDMLGDFDVAVEHTDKGWTCGLDLPEKRRYWQSREQLWTEHCFEPFLEWCNETLSQPGLLAFYQYGEGSTWAKILRDDDDPEQRHRIAVIPLRKGKSSVEQSLPDP